MDQYSISNIYQVIEPQKLRTAVNVLSLVTGLIANSKSATPLRTRLTRPVLYFNIGMKTVYLEVFQDILRFPAITSTKGRWLWYGLGPLYWIIAFVIAAAVPNLSGIVNFIGGLLGLNFTYAFPAIVYLGWSMHEGASLPGEGFDPVSGETTYHDAGPKRWTRGFFARWWVNVPVFLYLLGALASSGMGTWAAVEGLIAIFGPGGTVATSFGCPSPVWNNA